MRIPALSLTAMLLLASCTQPAPEPAPVPESTESAADARAAIEAQIALLAEGMASGDMTAVVPAIYTADARFHPPQARMVEGHDAILAAFNAVLATGLTVKPRPVYIDIFGDVAFEFGIGEITTPDGQTVEDTYVVLWKKDGGTWKMHRDYVNGTLP